MGTASRHSARRGLTALAALAVAGAFAAPAFSASVPATFVPGNPKCADYGLEGFKPNSPSGESNPSGTWGVGLTGKTITVVENSGGYGIDWTSTLGIDKVILKGGPNANVYTYDPPAESFGDTNLTTPINNNKPYGLSHVEFCYDLELGVSKTAAPKYDRTFDWTIAKNVDKSSVTTSDNTVTFNYTVDVVKLAGVDSNFAVEGSISIDNPFGVAKDVVITDDILGRTDETCVVSGAQQGVWSVPAGGASYAYSCSLPTKADGTNKVTITWSGENSDSFEAPFTFGTPTTVKNNSVDVTDAFDGALPALLVGGDDITASKTFTYSHTVDVPTTGCTEFPNLANIKSPDDVDKNAGKIVEVCRKLVLDVSKTAVPTFDREFDWTITKNVDKSSVTTTDNTVTFNYTVTATKSAGVDSNFKVAGSITVTNPFDTSKNVVITDDILGRTDETCVVSGALDGVWSVPAGGASYAYSCSLPTKANGTNQVTIAWDEVETDVFTAPFTFGEPTTVKNNSVDVTDAFNGAAAALLTGGDDITATKTFTYSRTVNVPTTGCTTFPNIANIMSTDGLNKSANASVQACREVPPVTPPAGPPAPPAPPTGVLGTNTPPKAGLKVTKTGPRAATAGQVVTYTITVKNTGKARATSVVLRDLLPSGYALAGKVKGATFSAGTLSWKVGTLAPGKSKTVKVSFRIDRSVGGRRCNTATATASGVAAVRDIACTRIAAVAGAVQPAVTG